MTATMSSGMVVSKADEFDSVGDIMTHLDHSLFLKADEFMYTALCLSMLDTERSELTFALAAFNEPLMTRGTETTRLISSGTVFPLGAFEDSSYREKTIVLDY